jgi:tetratricopeptide (TPR) repeat protein
LESVPGLFDEVIVIDTGSADRTVEIALLFGASVSEFLWCDDFAAARNASLARATGDFAFWLDADEFIEPADRERLRLLLDGLQPGDEVAFTGRFVGPGIPEPGVFQARLFPARLDIRWMCPVHEAIWPAIRRAGVPLLPSGVAIHHTGYADATVHARKRGRNERILRRRLAESPDDPFALWHMGRILAAGGEWSAALELYRRSLGSWPPDLMADAPRAYIAQAEWELGNRRGALQTCSESVALAPHHAPAWFAKGQMHHGLGELAEAERCWRHVLNLVGGGRERMACYDPRFESCRARRGLATLALARGDRDVVYRLHQEMRADDAADREDRGRVDILEPGLGGER